MASKKLALIIDQILSAQDDASLKGILDDVRVEDIAEILKSLDVDDQNRILSVLDIETEAEVLAKTNPEIVGNIIGETDPEHVAKILDQMPSEEVADAVSELKEENASHLLDLMAKVESDKVKKILRYPEDTAGRLMSSEYVAMNVNTPPSKAIEYIRQREMEEPFYYVYAVDNDNRFVGSVPIQKILFSGKNQALGDLIDEDTVTVSAYLDQEKVAGLVKKYDIPALPVVDDENRLVGRITVDDILDVIDEENTEDIYRMVGTNYEEVFSQSAFKIAKIRLPWLVTCIFGSLLSATVIRYFEVTLREAIVLVSFIPVIMATGGNTGLQSCTIMVRRIALGHLSSYNIMSNIYKEIRTALILGTVCGSILFLITRFWRGNNVMGIIIGVSMFLAVSASSIVGIFVPILFKKLKIDPAVASGPLITTINDTVGLSIYLLLSTFLLSHITG